MQGFNYLFRSTSRGLSLKEWGLDMNLLIMQTCNNNFSNGQSIGIVLYGTCSHSLYIKGEN